MLGQTDIKPDHQTEGDWIPDSPSHAGALGHWGTFPALLCLPQTHGVPLPLSSQMLPPAQMKTNPGDSPVAYRCPLMALLTKTIWRERLGVWG